MYVFTVFRTLTIRCALFSVSCKRASKSTSGLIFNSRCIVRMFLIDKDCFILCYFMFNLTSRCTIETIWICRSSNSCSFIFKKRMRSTVPAFWICRGCFTLYYFTKLIRAEYSTISRITSFYSVMVSGANNMTMILCYYRFNLTSRCTIETIWICRGCFTFFYFRFSLTWRIIEAIWICRGCFTLYYFMNIIRADYATISLMTSFYSVIVSGAYSITMI